jgi:hypothetical protein
MPTVLDTVAHYIEKYEDERTPSDMTVAHAPIVSDDEPEEQERQVGNPQEILGDTTEEPKSEVTSEAPISEFNLELNLQDEDETGATNFTTSEQEYLYWHTKLGHLSKTRMQKLAKRGAIPKSLAKLDPPMCVACIHGKATKKPWRTKANPAKTPKIVTIPGECVAVDQMESSTAGLIGQLRGAMLTKLRYKCATVFVDMFSDYTYVYLHTKITSEETVKAKKAFEAHAESFGVKIKQYHADNGRFQDVAFKAHCDEQGQALTFTPLSRDKFKHQLSYSVPRS